MSRFRWILLLLFVLAAINLAPLLYMLVLSLRGPIAESRREPVVGAVGGARRSGSHFSALVRQ